MNDSRDSDSPFGVLDFLAWDHSRFGYHYRAGELERSAALMKEAGVGFVRFDFLWDDIEPEEGRFIFHKYDRIVDVLTRYNIKIQGLLAYSPSWSRRLWNYAPDSRRYALYAQAVVNHFKDHVRHWEIWHEPDSPAFWWPQDYMRTYTDLLRHVYPLLKAVDPSCVVHLGGMSRSLPMGLKRVYENGGRGYFDVVNIHPFANPLRPDPLDALRSLHQIISQVLEEQGDGDKPIWFTEIGCPGMRDPAAAPHWWLGPNPDEAQQADWVRQVYGEPLRWKGVKKIFWCFFRETEGHFKSGSDYDGLVRHDFSKKPSFEAYRHMTLDAVPAASGSR